MQTFKISQVINQIKEFKQQRDESTLRTYDIMLLIERGKLWKKDSFYDIDSIDKADWKKAKFNFILKELAGWTKIRYENIKKAIALPDGRSLFIKYGYKNMVAYLGHTKEEMAKLLLAVEAHIAKNKTTPDFYAISKAIFPGRKVIPIENGFIAEKRRLKEEIEKLQNEVAKLQGEIETLKAENVKLREQVIEKLLSYG